MEVESKRPINSNVTKLTKWKEEANSFSLEVAHSEKKVVFTLQDYINWVIYQRE
jgi:hypothetical protein